MARMNLSNDAGSDSINKANRLVRYVQTQDYLCKRVNENYAAYHSQMAEYYNAQRTGRGKLTRPPNHICPWSIYLPHPSLWARKAMSNTR